MVSRITVHELFSIVSLGTNAAITAMDLSPSAPFGKSGSFRVRSELNIQFPLAFGLVHADIRMSAAMIITRRGISFLSCEPTLIKSLIRREAPKGKDHTYDFKLKTKRATQYYEISQRIV